VDIQTQLKNRFIRAIQKSFRPCPLIGDKWFHFHPDGDPAHMQFVGCGKLSKAMGKNPKLIAQIIVKNMYLRDLKAGVEITHDAKINLRLHKKPAVGENESSSSD
jgi:arginyl-tRNA synthetase